MKNNKSDQKAKVIIRLDKDTELVLHIKASKKTIDKLIGDKK